MIVMERALCIVQTLIDGLYVSCRHFPLQTRSWLERGILHLHKAYAVATLVSKLHRQNVTVKHSGYNYTPSDLL